MTNPLSPSTGPSPNARSEMFPAQGRVQQYPSEPRVDNPHSAALVAPRPELWGNIPAGLRERPQWAMADANKRPWTVDGRPASSTDPSTWSDFNSVAIAAYEKGWHIGYMEHEDDPFTCIDLDVKETTSHQQIEQYQNIVTGFDSYTERSRSGKGLHVWVEGNIGKGRRRDGVEVYSQERFIICTGDVVIAKPIFNRKELLEKLVGEMDGASSGDVEFEFDGNDCADLELATRVSMEAGRRGDLFRGNWEGSYPSKSEADLALVMLLLPDSRSTRECWNTFRLSELGQRDKAASPSYARHTMAAAVRFSVERSQRVQHGRQIAETLLSNASARGEQPPTFRLLSDADLHQIPAQHWLVKGLVPEGSVGTIFGQSGTFKSFLALDLLAHIANGQSWFGHRVKAAPAVYVPFEGQGGIPKRVAAWRVMRERAGWFVTTNMRFITDSMNLRLSEDRDRLVDTLTQAGWAGGVLCIDTLAQASVGIDENTSQGMGEMIAIFQELQRRLGGAVLVVHHSGKVESAGMRGWSGLRGALDFAIKCWREDSWHVFDAQFVLDKVKDGESGRAFKFSMLKVHLGIDEDGDEISSLTVMPPLQREGPPDVAALAVADDEFVLGWVRHLIQGGGRPTGRGLDAKRGEVKEYRDLTQARLRDAIARLKDVGRLMEEKGGPSGAKWLRAVDAVPQQPPQ